MDVNERPVSLNRTVGIMMPPKLEKILPGIIQNFFNDIKRYKDQLNNSGLSTEVNMASQCNIAMLQTLELRWNLNSEIAGNTNLVINMDGIGNEETKMLLRDGAGLVLA